MGSVKLAKDAHPHETLANLLQTHDTRSPLPPAPRLHPMLHQAVIGTAATFPGMAKRPSALEWLFIH